MISIKVNTSGFELTKSVPESVEEYNALAPSRTNPVLEDAIDNVLYRGTYAEFRSKFSAALAKDSGVARKTKTTGEGEAKKEVFDETEGKHIARVQAELGLDDEAFVGKYQALAQQCMDEAKFDPSVKEKSSDGPKIGKNDLKMATELIAKGESEVARVTGLLGAKLNRTVASDEKSIASAFADYRRQKAAEVAAQTKAEFAI